MPDKVAIPKNPKLYAGEGVIRTYTGKYINVFDPDPEMIDIEDIAHSLSNTCRWGGHCRKFYSVAQHSVMVVDWLPVSDSKLRLAGLMHDATEAYLTDLSKPIK